MLLEKRFLKAPIRDITYKGCQLNDACQEITLHNILVDCKAFYHVYDCLAQGNKIPVYDSNQEKFEVEMKYYLEKQVTHPYLKIL